MSQSIHHEQVQRSDAPVVQSPEEACPECGTPDSVVSSGDSQEIYCDQCGLILEEDQIDYGPEWSYANADSRRRVGSPNTACRHDRGISSEIGHWKDARGNELPAKTKRHFSRLRRWNSQAKYGSKKEKNLAHGLTELRRVASVLELPRSLQEQASDLFHRASDADLLRGLSIEAIAAACVYAVCRLNRLPRYLSEVANASVDSERRVSLAYRTLNVELDLRTPPPQPTEFVPRIARTVGLPVTVQRYAQEISTTSEMEGFAIGRNPRCVAAGCLYYAAREIPEVQKVTQAALSKAADVSTESVRSVWKRLEELSLDFSD